MKRFGLVGLVGLVVAAAVVLVVSGCSTVPKHFKEDMTGMKTKVDTLESRVDTVETKQAEVEKISAEQLQAIEEIKAQKQQQVSKSNVGIKSRSVSAAELQAALKNAGFYDGKLDGVKGPQTKSAIKAFQEANGLRADGVVGPKTWDLLCRYAAGDTGGTSESGK